MNITTEFNIGQTVYRIVGNMEPPFNPEWVVESFVIDKITITKCGLSYHCYRANHWHGWQYGDKQIFTDRLEAERRAAELNTKVKQFIFMLETSNGLQTIVAPSLQAAINELPDVTIYRYCASVRSPKTLTEE